MTSGGSGINWEQDTTRGVPGQEILTARVGIYTAMLTGDYRQPAETRWVGQVDGRLVSAGRVSRGQAEADVERRLTELALAERRLDDLRY